MTEKTYSDEFQRAMARSDATKLIRQIDAYAAYMASGAGEWPEELSDDFFEIGNAHHEETDKAMAYLALAVELIDDPEFLIFMACGTLEDLLREPTSEMIERVVAEARKSPRFRWMLSSPYKVAVSEAAWKAIEKFRITGPHEEPLPGSMPSRQ